MHRAQEQVRDFHRAMGQPCPDQLGPISIEQLKLRIELIREEFEELKVAADNAPTEIFDTHPPGSSVHPTPELIDAVNDLLYVVYGFGVEMGADLHPFFELVHEANMKKGPGPVRPDGKKLKPPGWKAPDHTEEMRRQMGVARSMGLP